MTERRLSIDMGELEAAFEDASNAVHYYLDLATGQVVAITDEIRDELEAIYEELDDDEHGLEDDVFAAALEQRELPAWMREALDQAHQVERGYGERYIAVPTADSHESYRDMEDFIAMIGSPHLRSRLADAIQGRGAFRRFKDILLAHPQERERWFAYSAARVRERVLAWLAEERIEAEDARPQAGGVRMSDAVSPNPIDDERFDLEREPLDRPPPFERDWGGDGTDLNRPVRAHVLAALRPNTASYLPPVDALRELGDPRNEAVAERRQALGLAQEHVPDLIRMARDRGLSTADSDTDDVWAPLHAFYALSDLDASAVAPEIIPLFDVDDDWLDTPLPELLGKIGAPALEPIQAYLADRARWVYGHAAACRALEQIAQQHPELYDQVVAMLSDVLRDAEHNDEVVNTAAMDALVELEAVEALPLIRRAFELGRIDEMMRGGWGDVLGDLGIEPEDDDPLVAETQRRFEERQERFFPRAQREEILEALGRWTGRDPQHLFDDPPAGAALPAPRDPRKAAQAKARKHKNKCKAESASRKANRRKRK